MKVLIFFIYLKIKELFFNLPIFIMKKFLKFIKEEYEDILIACAAIFYMAHIVIFWLILREVFDFSKSFLITFVYMLMSLLIARIYLGYSENIKKFFKDNWEEARRMAGK